MTTEPSKAQYYRLRDLRHSLRGLIRFNMYCWWGTVMTLVYSLVSIERVNYLGGALLLGCLLVTQLIDYKLTSRLNPPPFIHGAPAMRLHSVFMGLAATLALVSAAQIIAFGLVISVHYD